VAGIWCSTTAECLMERVPILRLGDALLVWAQVDLWGRQCSRCPG
jgi:hypothetical protein